jgi:hypothetical protein
MHDETDDLQRRLLVEAAFGDSSWPKTLAARMILRERYQFKSLLGAFSNADIKVIGKDIKSKGLSTELRTWDLDLEPKDPKKAADKPAEESVKESEAQEPKDDKGSDDMNTEE